MEPKKKGKPISKSPGIKFDDAFGRMYSVHPNQQDFENEFLV